jgi:hypothetical protein
VHFDTPHRDAIFREAAFAMLSFAAGEYALRCWHGPRNGRMPATSATIACANKRRFISSLNGDDSRAPIAHFEYGAHERDVAPGSALPESTMYWFTHVVVCLDDDALHQRPELVSSSSSGSSTDEHATDGATDGRRYHDVFA